jgi:hypothetical protein
VLAFYGSGKFKPINGAFDGPCPAMRSNGLEVALKAVWNQAAKERVTRQTGILARGVDAPISVLAAPSADKPFTLIRIGSTA